MRITLRSSSDSQLLIFSLHFFHLSLICISLSASQGPHIASVTLAAYDCGSVDFPEPPYPALIVCPEQEGPPGSEAEQLGVETVSADGLVGSIHGSISLWTIMSKVRLEACLWVSVIHML